MNKEKMNKKKKNKKKKFEKDYFMGKTSGYTGGYIKAEPLMKSRSSLVLRYKRKGRLLDVGCAYGFFLEDVKSKFDCYGFDVSKYAIKKAKKRVKADLKAQSAEKKWPYKENFFDVITMWDLVEHLAKPKIAVSEAERCLKNGGYLFIQTPNKFIRNLIGERDKTHISKKNIIEWKKIFKKNGFKIIEVHTEFPRFVGRRDRINKFLRAFRLPLGTNSSFVLKKDKKAES